MASVPPSLPQAVAPRARTRAAAAVAVNLVAVSLRTVILGFPSWARREGRGVNAAGAAITPIIVPHMRA
nr:hypothetical protein KPHV_66820 [Kitasatospora purpeofusca]